MRFPGDMGVSMSVVDHLRQDGHDVIHLRDEGLQCLPNGKVFEKASRENRILLTFDLDFSEIAALSGGESTPVITFRLRITRSSFVIARLDQVLDGAGHRLSKDIIVTVEENRYRLHEFPFG